MSTHQVLALKTVFLVIDSFAQKTKVKTKTVIYEALQLTKTYEAPKGSDVLYHPPEICN